MSFDEDYIIQKINKFAPDGYRFKSVGKKKQIALVSSFMKDNKPTSAFISDISIEMLDDMFGSLLSSRRMRPISHCSENFGYCYLVARSKLPEEKYKGYKSILSNIEKPLSTLFIEENAYLVYALQEKEAHAPGYLRKRLHNYVNYSVWSALRSVFAKTTIADLRSKNEIYSKVGSIYRNYNREISVRPVYANLAQKLAVIEKSLRINPNRANQVLSLVKMRLARSR